MASPYCRVHERLFDPQRHAWLPWPRLYVEMFEQLCALLDAAQIDCADYHVPPTACDRCTHSARQAVDASIEPGEQSP